MAIARILILANPDSGQVAQAMWWVGGLRRLCGGWLVKSHFTSPLDCQLESGQSQSVRAECGNNLLLDTFWESRNFLVKWYNSHGPLERGAMEKN